MKQFLKNYDFEDAYAPHILSRGKNYFYERRILDIWCQDNFITAYIEGSEIYKVELRVSDNKLLNFNCSCPYSENGECFCKHVAAVLYYLKEHDIPELEIENKKQVSENLELCKIYDEMQFKLNKISDKYGFVDYFNGKKFVDLIEEVSVYIDDFISNQEFDNAYKLIKLTYRFIKDTSMDGSNGEYQDAFYIISESASKLLYNDKYFDVFYNYAESVGINNTLDDFSDYPLYAFVLYAHDKASAIDAIRVLEEIDADCFGMFVNKVIDKISLTYDFIDKDSAIKMCYENMNTYGVKELLIRYLKDNNKIDEIVHILKDDIKNHVRKDMAYDKLLNIYDEYGMLEEKKKILPEVIIETSSFPRYKELKNICSSSEWNDLKDKIISQIKPDNVRILKEIYNEEKEVDKLFELLKDAPTLFELAKYQGILKAKYDKELLNFYRKEIIKCSETAKDRGSYSIICYHIGLMKEIDNSDDFIFDMLKEMQPNYKSKKAFKEEILKVLSSNNKYRFYTLIT